MSWYLGLIITDQGHVIEILLSSQDREGLRHDGLEIIPLQTEPLGHHEGTSVEMIMIYNLKQKRMLNN